MAGPPKTLRKKTDDYFAATALFMIGAAVLFVLALVVAPALVGLAGLSFVLALVFGIIASVGDLMLSPRETTSQERDTSDPGTPKP